MNVWMYMHVYLCIPVVVVRYTTIYLHTCPYIHTCNIWPVYICTYMLVYSLSIYIRIYHPSLHMCIYWPAGSLMDAASPGLGNWPSSRLKQEMRLCQSRSGGGCTGMEQACSKDKTEQQDPSSLIRSEGWYVRACTEISQDDILWCISTYLVCTEFTKQMVCRLSFSTLTSGDYAICMGHLCMQKKIQSWQECPQVWKTLFEVWCSIYIPGYPRIYCHILSRQSEFSAHSFFHFWLQETMY